MSYLSQLADVQQLLQGKVLDPKEAVMMAMQLEEDRRVRRQERRSAAAEAQQGLLSSLVTTAQGAASEGTPMSELRPMLDSLVAASGQPTGLPYGKIPGIDQLYSGGTSTVNPGLDTKDESVITNMVFDKMKRNPNTYDAATLKSIRDQIHAEVAPIYGNDYANLVTSIDAIIEEAYGRAAKGY